MPRMPSLFDLPFGPSFDTALEKDFGARFAGSLAGIDEAGRGPWAGPVVTAAVVLDYQRLPDGLNDSKKLNEKQREELFEKICDCSAVAVATASPATIDQLNIRAATLQAMAKALRALPQEPEFAVVDGRDLPPGLGCDGQALVKGDARCLAVAAASIVAKVTRDRMMVRLDQFVPGYGFAQHKGYGVPVHADALRRLGPTVHHRHSFKPIAAAEALHPSGTK